MSEPSSERPKVPEGKTEYVTTTQMEANEKGFVGYKTEWKSFQKEVPYQTPKKPWLIGGSLLIGRILFNKYTIP